MIELTVLKRNGKPKLMAAVKPKSQHLTIPKNHPSKSCNGKISERKIAAPKLTVDKNIAREVILGKVTLMKYTIVILSSV